MPDKLKKIKQYISLSLIFVMLNASVGFSSVQISSLEEQCSETEKLLPFENVQSENLSSEEASEISGEVIPIVVAYWAVRLGFLANSGLAMCLRSPSCMVRIDKLVRNYCKKHRC